MWNEYTYLLDGNLLHWCEEIKQQTNPISSKLYERNPNKDSHNKEINLLNFKGFIPRFFSVKT